MKQATSSIQLRRFGFVVSAGLALIGLLSWYRGNTTMPEVLWTIATILLLLGLILPKLLRPVHTFWMGLAMALAWINTRIILTCLFYAVFTPVGMIMRLFRDPLSRLLRDGRVSYWIMKEPKPFDPKTYENQF